MNDLSTELVKSSTPKYAIPQFGAMESPARQCMIYSAQGPLYGGIGRDSIILKLLAYFP